jgi:cellulose synthase/poly-beta-1,6-N-acetylglucosamine synthase-like glycosyltransferase
MSIEGLVEAIVIATTVAFVGFYGFYGTCCYWYLKRRKDVAVDPVSRGDAPKITVIVPTYNEESVIARRIENFKSVEYPRDKLQVVIVDDSTDSTPEIIKQMGDHSLDLTLIKRTERGSFNDAVKAGFEVSTGSIISITGAETSFAPDSLQQIVKHFSREDVGAVTGRMVTENQQVLSGKLEKAYRDIYDFMRHAESLMGSCFDVKGELNAARRDVLEGILKNQDIASGKGSADTCFAFQSIRMGMRTVYEPKAVYYENAPANMQESFQQTIRRGQVHMEAMSMYRDIFFNPNFGISGLLIAPAHLAMVFILPLIFGLQTFFLVSLFVIDPTNLLAVALILLELLVIALSRHAQAFAKIQVCLIGAMGRRLLGRRTYGEGHTRLQSTRLAREELVIGEVRA